MEADAVCYNSSTQWRCLGKPPKQRHRRRHRRLITSAVTQCWCHRPQLRHRGLHLADISQWTHRRHIVPSAITVSIDVHSLFISSKFGNVVVTCEIKLFQNYFSLRRRPPGIIWFQRVETCLKLFWNYLRVLLQLMNVFSNLFNVAE